MKIKILGTRGEIEETSPEHEKHSGILVDSIMLDIGEPEYLDLKPKMVFISHLHPDHAFFLKPNKHPPEIDPKYADKINEIMFFSPEIPKGANEKKWLPFKVGDSLDTEKFFIIPIPTLHSKKVKSVGFFIKSDNQRIFYSSDMIWIRKKDREHLKNLDLVITDGSFDKKGGMIRKDKETGEIYGHQGIPNLINFFKKLGAKKIIFTHFGTWMIKDPKEGKLKVRGYGNDIGVEAATDGMVTEVESLQMKTPEVEPITPKKFTTMEEPQRGVYLIEPHARWIWEGKKTATVKSKKYEIGENEVFYLLGDSLCYGKMILGQPEEITLEEFKKRENEHKITDEMRKEWAKEYPQWATGPLYFYKVLALESYEKPLPVELPRGPQMFIKKENIIFKNVKALSRYELEIFHALSHSTELFELHDELKKEFDERSIPHLSRDYLDRMMEFLIQDWKTYDPMKLIETERGQKVLGDDHRIVHAWWKSLKRGKVFGSEQFKGLSRTEQMKIVWNLHEKIVEAFKKLDWEHDSPLEKESKSSLSLEQLENVPEAISTGWFEMIEVDFKQHTISGNLLLKNGKVKSVLLMDPILEDELKKIIEVDKLQPRALKIWILEGHGLSLMAII